MIIGLFALTFVMMKQNIIGAELISTGDQGKFKFSLEYDKSTSIQQNNITSQEIEEFILHQKDVESVFSNVGGPSTGIGSLGVGSPNKTEFTIQLKPSEERNAQPTERFMRDLRSSLQKTHPSINYSMAALGLIPRSAPVELTLSGSDLKNVMKVGTELKGIIEKIPGADNVQLSVEAGSPEYKIVPNQDKMQRFGLNTAFVRMNLRTALTGDDNASLTENGTEYPIRIWFDDLNRENFEDLKNITIINSKGIPVKVSQFAEVVQDNSPSLLERKDRQAAVTLTSDALGRPSGTVADDVVAYLKENPLPD
jgi:HAE1 family hydrophobic/amphiphilic exporter-1